MSLLSQPQPPAIPLQLLIPQMLCFMLKEAPKGTQGEKEFEKHQGQLEHLEKQLEDTVQKNKQLTDLRKNLEEKLHEEVENSRKTHNKSTELYRNATIRNQQLQKRKMQLQQLMNSPKIEHFDQKLKLREYHDQCMFRLQDTHLYKASLLKDFEGKKAALENATSKTDDLENEINKKERQIDSLNRQIQQLNQEIQVKMASTRTVTGSGRVTTPRPTKKPVITTAITAKTKPTTLPPTQKPLPTTPVTVTMKPTTVRPTQKPVPTTAATTTMKPKTAPPPTKKPVPTTAATTTMKPKTAPPPTQKPVPTTAVTDRITLATLPPIEEPVVPSEFEIEKEQLKQHVIDAQLPDRNVLLTEAVGSGNVSLILALIELGAPANVTDSDGFTPAFWAITDGNAEAVELLLKAGVDVNAPQGEDEDTLLHISARNGDIDVVEKLLKFKANPNSLNKNQNTPLHEAAYFGHEEVAKVLLDNNAMIDAQNNKNSTPLLFAAARGHLPIVELLVERGADRNMRNNAGRTPQEEAQHRGKQRVSSWLGKQT